MASPAGLQLFLGRRAPGEVLQRIFEFGWHLWLAKPHDYEGEYGQEVVHLVRIEDIRPDVYLTTTENEWDEELDVERRVERRWAWPQYYEKEYLEFVVEVQREDIVGLSRPIVRKKRRSEHYGKPYNGEDGYHDAGTYIGDDGRAQRAWFFLPVHLLRRKRPRRHLSQDSCGTYSWYDPSSPSPPPSP